MNVNPFSYLIEKLKGKVDKSGDTMTGDLVINKADSTLSLRASGSRYTHLKSSASGADKTVTFPNASGTIALTSDLNTNVCFVSVANENASYTPDKEGLYAFGNKGASTTSFAFVYLLKNTTYTVTQAGLGLGSDPAPGNPKYLFAIKPNI